MVDLVDSQAREAAQVVKKYLEQHKTFKLPGPKFYDNTLRIPWDSLTPDSYPKANSRPAGSPESDACLRWALHNAVDLGMVKTETECCYSLT